MARAALARTPSSSSGQGDVLAGGEPGKEVEVLEHVADRSASHLRPLRARDTGEVDPVHEHLAAGRLLEASGDRQERALARAAWAHDRHQLAALDGEVDLTEGAHLGRPGAVGLRYLAKFECACHCETSIVRVGSRGRSATAAAAFDGRCLKRTSAASSHRTIASSRNSSASATSASASVVLAGGGLDLGVALHDLDHVPAVHLQDLVDIRPGNLEGDEHLDHELVARGRHEVGWGAKPVGQLARAGGRDPVPLPRALALPVVGHDEPVALEALEGRVHLADVERPHLARLRLELILESQAVLRAFAQQGEEGVGDAHERLHSTIIPSSILSIDRLRKSFCAASSRECLCPAQQASDSSARKCAEREPAARSVRPPLARRRQASPDAIPVARRRHARPLACVTPSAGLTRKAVLTGGAGDSRRRRRG